MRNTLTDLNNHLFMAMERLNDEELKGDDLKREIERSKAMSSIAGAIVSNASLALDAAKFRDSSMGDASTMPKLLQ